MTQANLLKSLFHTISLPCLVLKPEGEAYLIVDANTAYLQITDSDPKDLLGRPASDAFPENPTQASYGFGALLESYNRVILHKKKDRKEGLRYDIPVRGTENFQEKYWNIENAPVLNDLGDVEYILHSVQDVTEQILLKRKEQQLQKAAEEQRQQVSHFINAHPDGLYSMDKEGNFLTANQSLAQMAEIPLEELMKRNFLPFCSQQDRVYTLEHFQKALGGQGTRFEAKFNSVKGREVILDISLAPMEFGGQVSGVYGIARDLTPLRYSEKTAHTKKNYLRANAVFINSLLQDELTESSLENSLGLIGEAVDVDRISFFLAHPSQETRKSVFSLKMEWTKEKVQPHKNRTHLQNFPKEKLKQLIGDLRRDELFSANISELPEGDFKKLMQEGNLQALLMLPVFLKNRMQGMIMLHDCSRERHWNEEEISFLKTLAANLTTSFEKRAAKIALKDQQEALKRSEQKFRALVQESADLFAILDLEGNFSFKSDSTTRVLGNPPEEYLGRNALEFVHPEDLETVRREFASLANLKRVEMTSYRFLNRQNQWRWLETTLTNLMEDPAIQGVVANSRDITGFKLQEQEIKQLNERYRLAATATQDLMYDWDMEQQAVLRFHKGEEFLGHSVTKIDERYFWRKNIHPEELEALQKKQEAMLLDREKNHIVAEYRFRRADGTFAHIMDRSYIIRNSEGKAIRMVGATRDISDLKANEEALKIANKRFNLAMRATNEMIWDWDMHTGKIKWGKVFKEIFGNGVSKESRPADLWYTKIHPEDRERVEDSLAAAISDPSVSKWREEYRMVKLNREHTYVDDRAFIVRDASGEAIRMVGSVLDTTESRMALKKIRKQNQLLREIAWDQSHLVRAPLARIKMLLDLMKLEEAAPMPQNEILSHLDASYEELDQVIRSIVKKSEMLNETA